MTRDASTPRFRAARPEDRAAILALPTRFEGDYVPYFLDEWLAERPVRLWVAEVEGRVAGFAHLTWTAPGEAWLHAMRIGVAHEGRGLGTAFTRWQLEQARAAGARVVRLITEEANAAVHRIMERLGVPLLARWRIADRMPVDALLAALGPGPEEARPVPPGDARELAADRLAGARPAGGRPALVAVAGSPWELRSLDAGVLAEAASRRQLFLAGEGAGRAVALLGEGEEAAPPAGGVRPAREPFLRWLAGGEAGRRRLLRALLRGFRAQGVERWSVSLPEEERTGWLEELLPAWQPYAPHDQARWIRLRVYGCERREASA
ncbi:MAG: GNAT family N-acetyltransferase [Bacillota bacterium]|nr:GNAT family N-acetyltransferase [Bacillota bacterium]